MEQENTTFKLDVIIDKKQYLAANMYYLRRYIGVREIVLLTLLFVLGLGLFLWTGAIWAIVLAALTVLILLGTVLFYYGTAAQGYKLEFQKRGARFWHIRIDKETFSVETEEEGDKIYPEKMPLASLDRVALKKDKIYLFFSGAMLYYIPYDATFSDGNFVQLAEFIQNTVPPEKFRFRRRRTVKQFPYSRV